MKKTSQTTPQVPEQLQVHSQTNLEVIQELINHFKNLDLTNATEESINQNLAFYFGLNKIIPAYKEYLAKFADQYASSMDLKDLESNFLLWHDIDKNSKVFGDEIKSRVIADNLVNSQLQFTKISAKTTQLLDPLRKDEFRSILMNELGFEENDFWERKELSLPNLTKLIKQRDINGSVLKRIKDENIISETIGSYSILKK